MKELSLLLMLFFYFRCHVAEKSIVDHIDWFGVILNLLTHLELLMYAKPISFMVGSTNVYGIIFYQVYLLPWITIPLMLYLTYWSPQHLYQDIQKYVVIVLMKLTWSNPSEKFLTDSICIIFWRNMCSMFIKILVITNTNSIFSSIAGCINHLQQRGCWWYQVSLMNWHLIYMSRW